ncbi:hypothetical protein ABER02_18265 [Rossellomorea marisflavi]|uniref:hypothetical protein n=1 Tax=Rossellomorea marisflavi TaxID=189381 RepID=UPI00064E3167|nr:hypothetical protein [Rossellomorea marisflavi]KML32372.1 hypothetical protein VL12_15345 [Rossellomorea marisflavi]
MGYKVKRGSGSSQPVIREFVLSVLKRLIGLLVVVGLMAGVGYLLLRMAYHRYPAFQAAADDVLGWVQGFYADHGIWATIGIILFVCLAVWAIGEEARRKERRRESMKEMMK